MNIYLKLGSHCIKTEARKRYNALVKKYFDRKQPDIEKSMIERQIDALSFFLTYADFSRLRARYPELSGTGEVLVEMVLPENFHEIKLFFNGKKISPDWR